MAKKSRPFLYVKILQNGTPVAEAERPLRGHKSLSITSSSGSELSLPLYPLIDDMDLLKIQGNKVKLFLNDPWGGILTSQKKTYHLSPLDRDDKVFILYENDYASIYLNDLHVLIKIASPKNEYEVPLDPSYSPKLLSLFLANKYESNSFLAGAIIACFLIGCVMVGLLSRKMDRPHVFEELADFYTLPFIDRDNITTGPEAMQETIDRNHLIASIVDFYRNFMNVYLGINFESNRYILPSSSKRYELAYSNYEKDLATKIGAHKENIRHLGLEKPLLSLPAVYGESFQQKIIRTISKINLFHESLKNNLADRRKASTDYRADPEYDWTNYLNPKDKEFSKDLAKIKVFDQNTNEFSMYRDAEEFGIRAATIKQKHSKKQNPRTMLTYDSIKPFIISHEANFISLLNPMTTKFKDDMFQNMIASTLGKPVDKSIKEPLIGQVDVEDLRRTIKNNKYKLNLCYEKALRRDHSLKGKTTWSWRVDSFGIPSEVDLTESTLIDSSFISCIRESISTWQFPRSRKGSIKVTHSFLFEPQSG